MLFWFCIGLNTFALVIYHAFLTLRSGSVLFRHIQLVYYQCLDFFRLIISKKCRLNAVYAIFLFNWISAECFFCIHLPYNHHSYVCNLFSVFYIIYSHAVIKIAKFSIHQKDWWVVTKEHIGKKKTKKHLTLTQRSLCSGLSQWAEVQLSGLTHK